MDDGTLTPAECDRILAEVSPMSRALMQMRFAQRMSYEDIGKELGLSVERIRSRMQLALVETLMVSKSLAKTDSRTPRLDA